MVYTRYISKLPGRNKMVKKTQKGLYTEYMRKLSEKGFAIKGVKETK